MMQPPCFSCLCCLVVMNCTNVDSHLWTVSLQSGVALSFSTVTEAVVWRNRKRARQSLFLHKVGVLVWACGSQLKFKNHRTLEYIDFIVILTANMVLNYSSSVFKYGGEGEIVWIMHQHSQTYNTLLDKPIKTTLEPTFTSDVPWKNCCSINSFTTTAHYPQKNRSNQLLPSLWNFNKDKREDYVDCTHISIYSLLEDQISVNAW